MEDLGIQTVPGKFNPVDKYCTKCKGFYKTHEEKRTDVNIAVKLIEEALKDSFDVAIIISGDSDLMPAVWFAKSHFTNKQFGLVIPVGRSAEELKSVVHFYMKMKEKHLDSCRLPETVTLKNGQTISCPNNWK